MNDGNMLREKRLAYGVTLSKLALCSGISRRYLSMIENGEKDPKEETKNRIVMELEKLNPEEPLFLLFDYVRIRFATTDIDHVIHNILKLNINFMRHEEYGMFGYTERYFIGDVLVLVSNEIEKGILLELRGKGCRQFENYMLAQERTWNDFFILALEEGGVMKRLDLAINDRTGILNVPELIRKCDNEECISVFRNFNSYASGSLVKQREQDRENMGHTLYIGSLKSDVYFCIYEKDYEQLVKENIPLEEAHIKNRFEIRLKNDRAYYALRDLLTYDDVERTTFAIINRYLRFVDCKEGVKRSNWEMNDSWANFLGKGRTALKLTTKPEPYNLEKTLKWIQKQVDPTLKMLDEISKQNGENYLEKIRENTILQNKHEMIIVQQTTAIEKLIVK